jgi:flavin-binding protein dodecin
VGGLQEFWVSAPPGREEVPAMSVYKVVEVIGTSTESWEDAGLTAVKKARETIRQLRVAEVVEQDLDLDDAGTATFRTKLRLSFKYEDEG